MIKQPLFMKFNLTPVIALMLLCNTAQSQQTKPANPVTVTITDSNRLEIDGKVFNKVEIEADFPGGVNAWIEYLQNNLKANVPVKKKAPAGTYTVVVRFIVSIDGSIRNIEAETNHGYGMEKEVMRIIKKGPQWNPAVQDGRKVNAYRRQPVTFVVVEE